MHKQAKYRKNKILLFMAFLMLNSILPILAFHGNGHCYEQTFYPRRDHEGPVHLVIEIKESSSKICFPPPYRGLKIECYGKIIWGPNEGIFETSFRIGEMGLKEHYISVEGFKKREKGEVTLTVFAELKGEGSDCYEIKRIDFREGESGFKRISANHSITSPKWSKSSDQKFLRSDPISNLFESIRKEISSEPPELELFVAAFMFLKRIHGYEDIVNPEVRDLLFKKARVKFGVSLVADAMLEALVEDMNERGYFQRDKLGKFGIDKYVMEELLKTAKNAALLDLKGEIIDSLFLIRKSWNETVNALVLLPDEESIPLEQRKYYKNLYSAKKAIDTFRRTTSLGPSLPSACLASVSSDRWKGEYFNKKSLSGNPSMIRDDGIEYLDFAWSGSPNPSCSIGTDNFSVRWTRTFYFDGGTWRFSVTGDDGVRLYVDGSLKIDKWFDQLPTNYIVDVPLSAGNHTIRMEYYESGGTAVAQLIWKKVVAITPTISPTVSMSPPSGSVGTTFTQTGKGFTLNRTATIYGRNPDGSVVQIVTVNTDSSGSFTSTWTAQTPGNNLVRWGVDNTTGKKSNEIVYNVTTVTGTPSTPPPYFSDLNNLLLKNQGLEVGPKRGEIMPADLSPCPNKQNTGHTGIDIPAKKYTPVYSPIDGEVIHTNPGGTGGTINDTSIVSIYSEEANITFYFVHLETISVPPGRVEVGKQIGTVGSRGISTGPHLHFEARRGRITTAALCWDQTIDPYSAILEVKRLALVPKPPLSPSGCLASVSSDRWKGEYFNKKSLSGNPSMIRDDGIEYLNFAWSGSPNPSCSIGTDNFSVRWTRTFYFDGGTWRFSVTGDDGVRLYVDGSLKIDKWFDQLPTNYIVDVTLSAGNHTIKMEYYESGGGAVAKLSWQKITSVPPPISPTVSMSPPSGSVGTTFTQTGKGFTPNNTATLHGRRPGGSVGQITTVNTDSSGAFSRTWKAETPENNLAWWAIDNRTNQKSNEVIYTVVPTSSTQKCPGGEEYNQPPHPQNVFTHSYRGYCTWYVADRWLHAGNRDLPSTGNAVKWLEDAKTKFLTGSKPEKGSIVVFGPIDKNPAGHVAYVESASGNEFRIAQMNAGGNIDRDLKTDCFNKVTRDTLQINQSSYKGMRILGFIYPQPVSQPPISVPTITFPGSGSEPGQMINTLTPTLQWSAVSGADYYTLAISKYPYGSGSIIYNPQRIYGTSHTVPSGILEYGQKYRWNIQAHTSGGLSAVSNTLYFQTTSTQVTNQPPNPPTNLSQMRASGTGIGVGATSNESTVVLKGVVSDPNNDTVKLQIELRRLDEYGGQFTGTHTQESPLLPSGSTATITVSGLINGSYHWRARTVDSKGATSPWLSAGGNPDSAADFIVSVGAPPPPPPPPPPVCTDGAQFVADVTIPDNSQMQPNQTFTKTWRLRNTGTGNCSWGPGYSLVFVGGSQMGAPGSVSVPQVPPNGTADISVPMAAPSAPGPYQGNWQMRNQKGQPFGPQIWVKINVASAPPPPPPPPVCTDGAQFVADVTIPDNTQMQPNQTFTKTWRLKNTGTGNCSWGPGYSLVFVGGSQMGAPGSVSVPQVPPNGTADISVPMAAPSAPGPHQGTWQMRNQKGQPFGPQIWVKINVVSAPPPPPPTCTDGAQFVADVAIPDGTQMQAGQRFTKIWRLRNTGTCAWGNGYNLVFVSGAQIGASGSVPVLPTPINGTTDIGVPMVAPSAPGTYQGYWQMRNQKGQPFGPQIWVKIVVSAPQPVINPQIQISTSPSGPWGTSASGQQGTTFYIRGSGFSPNAIVRYHVRKPDGSEYPPSEFTGKVDGAGNFNHTYTSQCTTLVGTYTVWVIDKPTGKSSNTVSELITKNPNCK